MGMNTNTNVDFIIPTREEDNFLDRLDGSYTKVSEMSAAERAFLNALILRNKPRKLLELGVSAGGSSVVTLNAIKDFSDAQLYSIDLNEMFYKNDREKTGYFVDNYPDLKSKWELLTGGLALNFMDKIGAGVDFCLIDTVHSNPGEILDFLMILPFLKDDAVVVFHDVTLHVQYFVMKKYARAEKAITNNMLMSAITGRKLLQGSHDGDLFANIGGIRIGKDTKENVFEIFNLLTIPWCYLPTDKQEQEIISWFERYYDKYYIDYLTRVFAFQKKVITGKTRYKIKAAIKKIVGAKNAGKIQRLARGG